MESNEEKDTSGEEESEISDEISRNGSAEDRSPHSRPIHTSALENSDSPNQEKECSRCKLILFTSI